MQTRQGGPSTAVLENLKAQLGEGKQQTLFTIRRKIEDGKFIRGQSKNELVVGVG
jgi:hypothetical protein